MVAFPATDTVANFSGKKEHHGPCRKTVTTAWPGRAFAYMADFSHAAEWDPGVAEAIRVDGGDVGQESIFDLTVLVGGRRLPMPL
jgi:hypothetical protein